MEPMLFSIVILNDPYVVDVISFPASGGDLLFASESVSAVKKRCRDVLHEPSSDLPRAFQRGSIDSAGSEISCSSVTIGAASIQQL